MAFVQFLGDALAYLKRAGPFKGLYIKPGPRRQPAALCKVLLWVRISVLRLLPRDPAAQERRKLWVVVFIYFFTLPSGASRGCCAQVSMSCYSQPVDGWWQRAVPRGPTHCNADLILSLANRWLVLQQSMDRSMGSTIVARRIFYWSSGKVWRLGLLTNQFVPWVQSGRAGTQKRCWNAAQNTSRTVPTPVERLTFPNSFTTSHIRQVWRPIALANCVLVMTSICLFYR